MISKWIYVYIRRTGGTTCLGNNRISKSNAAVDIKTAQCKYPVHYKCCTQTHLCTHWQIHNRWKKNWKINWKSNPNGITTTAAQCAGYMCRWYCLQVYFVHSIDCIHLSHRQVTAFFCDVIVVIIGWLPLSHIQQNQIIYICRKCCGFMLTRYFMLELKHEWAHFFYNVFIFSLYSVLLLRLLLSNASFKLLLKFSIFIVNGFASSTTHTHVRHTKHFPWLHLMQCIKMCLYKLQNFIQLNKHSSIYVNIDFQIIYMLNNNDFRSIASSFS